MMPVCNTKTGAYRLLFFSIRFISSIAARMFDIVVNGIITCNPHVCMHMHNALVVGIILFATV